MGRYPIGYMHHPGIFVETQRGRLMLPAQVELAGAPSTPWQEDVDISAQALLPLLAEAVDNNGGDVERWFNNREQSRRDMCSEQCPGFVCGPSPIQRAIIEDDALWESICGYVRSAARFEVTKELNLQHENAQDDDNDYGIEL